ncbi:hypothetical protein LCC91_09200 [Tepidimonas taiwanensis]|uniref:EF-hand domain-containing protein n=1 Tax=Tepidimonas taiwanensis TaxID=307486 RepID=A0A554X5X7_9BURK|nr:hypothetical protein [Tepidimonas taiwanensis]TSE31238.1 hypothetical protein Ttaiw_01616 [Tepidimonas taiwanensis]UBQ04738.1 hypothetical protein LCC91_09200 [Tepidimonas taiwanensis]
MTRPDVTPPPAGGHRWRFFRAGGVDQARLESADDLRALDTLDPKLWAALACPTAGLAIEPRTLAALDTDGDGRVRLPEVRAAVRWVCERLRDPGLILTLGDALPLAALADDDEGVALRQAARELLARVGRPDADVLTLADMADPAQVFPPQRPNGDGVVPVALAGDDALAAWIERIAAARGAVADRSGEPGLDEVTLDAIECDVAAVRAWRAAQPPGDAAAMAAALRAVDAVAAKVEDHYTRCRLAGFDARAAATLDWSPEPLQALGERLLDAADDALAVLPLAHVQPEPTVPLEPARVNPAWAAAIATLRDAAVLPLLGPREALHADDWQALRARLAAWRAWEAQRPDTPVAEWDAAWLDAWEGEAVAARLRALIAHDREAEPLAQRLASLQRLLHWRRDLGTLLRNVVNFADFYGGAQPAAFQAGTLYIDQRECHLCLPVADAAAHAQLAAYSGLYLLYCHCERAGEAPMTIVAALTAGDVPDFMVPGRNGVFVDRMGRDWSARVVRVVDNPISVREAFWAPYKRIARLVGEQVRKLAAAREQAVQAQAAQRVADGADAVQQGAGAKPAGQQAFDIARFAGIFAAIGLALGAIGTALAAVVTGFLQLAWWQMPLVVLGLMVLISGPSVLLAWFKLRQRNIGPLLDANGWAVNIRARIGIPFGKRLTAVAVLPAGAQRSADPDASASGGWAWWLLLVAVAAAVAWWLWRTIGVGG